MENVFLTHNWGLEIGSGHVTCKVGQLFLLTVTLAVVCLTWLPGVCEKEEFGDAGFCRGRKTGGPREIPSEQGENQLKTHST